MSISQDIVNTLKNAGVDLFATLPCDKAKVLYSMVSKNFMEIPLSREEEGVGICAGAYLAGAKPAMLIQSSGMGNMVNALCSLTKVYRLPLLIMVSWRGIYEEKIPAHIPLGKNLPKILEVIDAGYKIIENRKDISFISEAVAEAYKKNMIQAILLNPRLWEAEKMEVISRLEFRKGRITLPNPKISQPALTRYEILKVAATYLEKKVVVCNLGFPCKELYQLKHQKSNFYMLGSMGLASSIGLGISLFTRKDVVVIDGDGSLLMNMGALSTIAKMKPRNLTIIAIDNGVHGSAGNQPTATSCCVDLEIVARGMGLSRTYKVAGGEEISSVLQDLGEGPNFVHVLAKQGNACVPEIPLTPIEIKRNVMEALRSGEN
jgi:sulfopyruvate decarboxylase beta subunit